MKGPAKHRLGVVSASVVFETLHFCAACLSNWVMDLFRPFFLLAVTTLLRMTAAACLKGQLGKSVIAIFAAAFLSITAIYLWRHSLDSTAALGALPPGFEWVGLAVLGVTNVVLAVIVAAVFSGSRLLRYRWSVFYSIAISLLTFCVCGPQVLMRGNSQQALPQRVAPTSCTMVDGLPQLVQ